MNKHISTAAAAVALVSAIGLAYAQSDPQAPDTSTTPQAQQNDSKDAVNRGTSATPDWRSPDPDATAVDKSTAAPSTDMPAQQQDTTTPTPPAADNAMAAPAEPASTANAPDSSMNAAPDNSQNSTSAAGPATTTERAPRADRN